MPVLRILLEVTIYSTVLFLIILLFRAVFKKHASPVMLYAAWFLLVIRLMIPVTVGGISLIELPAQETAVQAQQADLSLQAEDTAGEAAVSPRIPAVITEETASGAAVIRAVVQQEGLADAVTPTPLWEWDWDTALTALWIAGAAVILLNMAVARAKLYKKLASAQRLPYKWRQAALRIQDELGIRSRIRFAAVRDFASPALSASLRPTVVIPMELLSQNDQSIEFAFKHELTHLKRGDHRVCLLLMLLKAIYWFNPVVWLAVRLMKMDMETACDSRVVSAMDVTEKKQYASTVLGMYAQFQPRFMLGMAPGSARLTAERRVRGIFMRQRSARGTKAAAMLLAAVMLVACFTTACQPVTEADTGSINTGSPEQSAAEITLVSESPIPTPAPEPEPSVMSALAEGDFLYSAIDGKATITGYTGHGGVITIPAKIGASEYPVTAIGDSAFRENRNITGVTIPQGVMVIGENAFAESHIENVVLPDSIIQIDAHAFIDSALKSINIPDGVRDINAMSFAGCSLESIDLPDSVIRVGEYAFVSCLGLTEINIPANVRFIDRAAFGRCESVMSLNVDASNYYYTSEGGVLFSKSKTILIQYPAGRSETSYSIPDTVTTIEDSAFATSDLRTVYIPDSVTSIDYEAFYMCQSLTKAVFAGNMPSFYLRPFSAVPDSFKVYYHISHAASWAGYTEKPKQAYCIAAIDPQNGKALYKKMVNVTGGHIAPPAAPVRTGYTFAGWYKEAGYENAWNFAADKVKGDIRLFAKWEINS